MQWEAIYNAYTPEFKVGLASEDFFNKKPARTDWYTWAPYTKGPRAIKRIPRVVSTLAASGICKTKGAKKITWYDYTPLRGEVPVPSQGEAGK